MHCIHDKDSYACSLVSAFGIFGTLYIHVIVESFHIRGKFRQRLGKFRHTCTYTTCIHVCTVQVKIGKQQNIKKYFCVWFILRLASVWELSIIVESLDSHVETFRTIGKFSTYMYVPCNWKWENSQCMKILFCVHMYCTVYDLFCVWQALGTFDNCGKFRHRGKFRQRLGKFTLRMYRATENWKTPKT